MAILAILGTIISAIGAIAGVIVDTGKAVLDTIIGFFSSVFSLFQSFVQSAPMPMKIAIFLFFILTFGNMFSNFFLSTSYACNGNNVLYKTDNIATAMSLMLKTQFQDMSVGDRNTFIAENYNLISQSASPTTIKCLNSQPKLYFYSVNVLDYKTWLLVLVLIFGVPIIWGYYSKMGALN